MTDLVDGLSKVRLPKVFNPYADICDLHDRPDAAAVRRSNLELSLAASADLGCESIWFGRDFGWRGGRRTGLSLTDEGHLAAMREMLGAPQITKATTGPAMVERTATVVWGVALRLPSPPVMWNAFPLHPHETESPLSNRAHSLAERLATAWTIDVLIQHLRPTRLIAVGNDAARALEDMGFNFDHVRHPSYGGQRDFISSMEKLHKLPSTGIPPDLFAA